MRIEELARASGPVRIERIEARRIAVPMREPFRISSGEVGTKEAILVQVWDGDAFGWGESSAMSGAFYSADTPDSCEQDLMELLGFFMPPIEPDDLKLISAPIDFLGVNYYTRDVVKAQSEQTPVPTPAREAATLPRTEMDWEGDEIERLL